MELVMMCGGTWLLGDDGLLKIDQLDGRVDSNNTMQLKRYFLGIALLAGIILVEATFAQGTIGSPTEGGVDRLYDDGFVRVDVTGNAMGYTAFWGYQYESQIEGTFLAFHYQTVLDSNPVIITDRYAIGNILPPAPYSGSFSGGGSLLPDIPSSREISSIPEPAVPTIILLTGIMLTGDTARRNRMLLQQQSW